MTYTQARLRIWNPDAYTRQQVHSAAIFILSCIDANNEDIMQASGLL